MITNWQAYFWAWNHQSDKQMVWKMWPSGTVERFSLWGTGGIPFCRMVVFENGRNFYVPRGKKLEHEERFLRNFHEFFELVVKISGPMGLQKTMGFVSNA